MTVILEPGAHMQATEPFIQAPHSPDLPYQLSTPVHP